MCGERYAPQMRETRRGNLRDVGGSSPPSPLSLVEVINQKPIPGRQRNPKKSENVYRTPRIVEKSQHFFISLEDFFRGRMRGEKRSEFGEIFMILDTVEGFFAAGVHTAEESRWKKRPGAVGVSPTHKTHHKNKTILGENKVSARLIYGPLLADGVDCECCCY